jgi:hypothetical protein
MQEPEIEVMASGHALSVVSTCAVWCRGVLCSRLTWGLQVAEWMGMSREEVAAEAGASAAAEQPQRRPQ